MKGILNGMLNVILNTGIMDTKHDTKLSSDGIGLEQWPASSFRTFKIAVIKEENYPSLLLSFHLCL